MSLATGPPGGEKVTPQQALMQTMAAMHQKVVTFNIHDIFIVPYPTRELL
jgi:hypothetical protein